MQFHLVYRGPLRSNGDARHKHQIRRALHPQLKELWTHPPLDGLDYLQYPPPENGLSVVEPLGDFKFATLVNERLKVVAELEVVMLRPSPPGRLLRQGGDIDNQLKTLFDALRSPNAVDEIPRGDVPDEDEDPFFCLLDDDERIVDLRVVVDRLLAPPADDSSVLATIVVRTRPTKVIYGNIALA